MLESVSGVYVGGLVGLFVGDLVGLLVGDLVGFFVGDLVGLFVGELVVGDEHVTLTPIGLPLRHHPLLWPKLPQPFPPPVQASSLKSIFVLHNPTGMASIVYETRVSWKVPN